MIFTRLLPKKMISIDFCLKLSSFEPHFRDFPAKNIRFDGKKWFWFWFFVKNWNGFWLFLENQKIIWKMILIFEWFRLQKSRKWFHQNQKNRFSCNPENMIPHGAEKFTHETRSCLRVIRKCAHERQQTDCCQATCITRIFETSLKSLESDRCLCLFFRILNFSATKTSWKTILVPFESYESQLSNGTNIVFQLDLVAEKFKLSDSKDFNSSIPTVFPDVNPWN